MTPALMNDFNAFWTKNTIAVAGVIIQEIKMNPKIVGPISFIW
jgi:hypothetical protein